MSLQQHLQGLLHKIFLKEDEELNGERYLMYQICFIYALLLQHILLHMGFEIHFLTWNTPYQEPDICIDSIHMYHDM